MSGTKNRRPRDSQRQRVYEAEDAALKRCPHLSRPLGDINETRAWVQRVYLSKTFRSLASENHAPGPYLKGVPVSVEDGRGRRNAAAYLGDGRLQGRWTIKLPRHTRTAGLALHELAHMAVPDDQPAHGWLFAQTCLKLVSRFAGQKAAGILKEEFRNHRVRFRPRRKRAPVTQERREQLVRLLHAARQRKAALATKKNKGQQS